METIEIIFSVAAIIIVIFVIVAYKWIHANDIKFANKKSNYEYTEELLRDERNKLMAVYNGLKGNMNEVTGDAWDIMYREYKCVEEALEINRERFKLLSKEDNN